MTTLTEIAVQAVLLELDVPVRGYLASHSGQLHDSASKVDRFESAIPLVSEADHRAACRKIATLAAQPRTLDAPSDSEWVAVRRAAIKLYHTHDFGAGPVLHADCIGDALRQGLAAGRAATPQQAIPEGDAALLDFLSEESLDLQCFAIPTPGGDDADIGWRTIQHHMSKPSERVASEVYTDDPRQAIREAMTRLARDPYCTGPLHIEDADAARAAQAEGGAASSGSTT